jgi:opacity protein-like surface antigen
MKAYTALTAAVLLTASSFAGSPTPEPTINQGPLDSNGWDFLFALYSPMMGMEGTIGIGPIVGEVDVPFSEIFDSLDAGFFGSFEARGDRWSVNGDIIWLKMSSSGNPGPNSYLGIDQEQFMSTITTGYELYEDEKTIFDIFGGIAMTGVGIDLDLVTALPGSPYTTRSASGSEFWVDPLVGMRVRHHLTDRWTVFALGSYGGFDVGSQEYWQLVAGISYDLTENAAIALAYRGIGVDYTDGGFIYNTKTYGPNLGVVFKF